MRNLAAACLLLIAAIVVGCAGKSAASPTRVTILAINPNVGRAVFHLSCAPAGGDIPDPAGACAALAAAPDLVTRPEPFSCIGGFNSWWDLTISGRLRGHPFHSHTSSCWTPQMLLIGKLGIAQTLEAHLLPRRHEELIGHEQRTFPPSAMRPGDLVTCKIHGRRLEDGVPLEVVGGGSEAGFGGGGVTTITLRVERHRDGSVTATCF